MSRVFVLRPTHYLIFSPSPLGLEQVAKVLKPDDVESDLVPAMLAFLRDMEDVR